MTTNGTPLPLFRNILLAADFSDSSRGAFDVACSLAREAATRLIVIHVEEPVGFLEMSGPAYVPGEDLTDREVLETQLREQYVPHGHRPVEYRVKPGRPTEEILRTAEDERCDLIVMGSHGRSGLRQALMGGVAEAVQRGARCPVLTIKLPVPAEAAYVSAEILMKA